jgi:tRNA(Ile)-lysidine synthase
VFVEKIVQTIKKYRMISGGDTVIAGVSGGVDSIVLLHILEKFVREEGGQLVVAHLHHGLRGEEADRDETFVSERAKKLGLVYRCRRVDLSDKVTQTGENLQAAARDERYSFFESVREEFDGDKIALGHNADDQAETVLMRIVRGCGIKGLAGIPPVRGHIVRPLIETRRSEIAAFAAAEGISYVEDSSNESKKYLRNSIRKELIPLIEGYNPQFCREMLRLSAISRETDNYIEDEASLLYGELRRYDTGREGAVLFKISRLKGLPSPVRTKLLLKALEELTGSRAGFFSSHLFGIIELVEAGKTGSSISLPKKVTASIIYGDLMLGCKHGEDTTSFSMPLNMSGKTEVEKVGAAFIVETSDAEEAESPDDGSCIFIDLDRIAAPLEVRNFRAGDRIRPLGMEGSKKLKDFFIDEKVPRHMRGKVPLVISGDDILWLVGYRKCGAAHANSESSRLIKLTKV